MAGVRKAGLVAALRSGPGASITLILSKRDPSAFRGLPAASDSAPPSTSRQKPSTRAFHSSGTSWKGWWASSSITSNWASGIRSATVRHSSGRLVGSRPPAITSVGAAISGNRSVVS